MGAGGDELCFCPRVFGCENFSAWVTFGFYVTLTLLFQLTPPRDRCHYRPPSSLASLLSFLTLNSPGGAELPWRTGHPAPCPQTGSGHLGHGTPACAPTPHGVGLLAVLWVWFLYF